MCVLIQLQKECGYEGAQSVLKKISKPSDLEVKELSKFFPSYQSKGGPSKKFDVGAKSVVEDNKKKKKTAIRKRQPKPSVISVILLDDFTPSVPRGNARHKLASSGKMQTVRFSRDMSGDMVKERISSVFNCSEYTYLEGDSSGHTLCKSSDQELDGEAVVDRKGCLYLCKRFPSTAQSSESVVCVACTLCPILVLNHLFCVCFAGE